MPLTLQIVSQQARAMGAAATFQFDEAGGSLGRVDGNDWILPDADRFVSSRHAAVSCEGGMWYLTDTSTNGTFVNDRGFLIGNGNTVPLNEGDRLFVGDYEIVVSIASGAAPNPNVESAATSFSTDSFFNDAQAGPAAPAAPGMGIDPSIPGAGQSLDPLDALMGGDDDPFGAPASPPTGSQMPTDGPSFAEDPNLDPMAGFDTPDLSADTPQQEQWPQGAGATPDHVSPMDQHFNPPHASTGVIPDDWVDATVFPDQPRAPSPPPQPAEPIAAPPAPPPAPTPPQPQVPGPPPGTAAMPPGPSPTGAYPQHAGATPQQPQPTGTFQQPPQPPGTFQQPAQPTGVFPQAPASEGTMQQPIPAVGEGSAEGLQRLLAAAGVDPSRMPPQAANAVFQLAGSVFREVVEGIMDVLHARDELKSELRIARTVLQSRENNPLKFSVSTDEALTKLLFPQEQGYKAPVEALREAIEDIKAHQMAMMAGLSAALTTIMEQFDPENLEDRFQKNLKHSPMAALRGKAKYWEMYEEYYQRISTEAKSNILALYGEEFAKAYEEQIDKLS